MKTLKWLNDKGNVSVKVREGVRKQIDEKLNEALVDKFEEIVPNANGGYSIPVAVDASTGKTIYATVSFVINTADPSEKVARKSAKKAPADEPEIPSLF